MAHVPEWHPSRGTYDVTRALWAELVPQHFERQIALLHHKIENARDFPQVAELLGAIRVYRDLIELPGYIGRLVTHDEEQTKQKENGHAHSA